MDLQMCRMQVMSSMHLKNDKKAKEIAENRKEKLRGELMATKSTSSLEEFFGKLQAGDTKQLNLIVKADVQESASKIGRASCRERV